jgi:NADPH:quinone reductase-like Zn-dependent oxidoreductase
MSKAVQFDRYGDVDVLLVRDVQKPAPGVGEVVVAVQAAGINPGWPATFPSGQGSDLAGVVDEVGSDVSSIKVGDEVIGFTDRRASQAEFVAVPADQLTPKPPQVPWEVAGGLFVAGTTAYAAVRAVSLEPGETVAVAGAAGGVGSIAVQLARRAGATVLGIAGPSNDGWLTAHGVIPVNYGPNLTARLRQAAPNGRVDAFLDLFGGGYVETAVSEIGIAPERVDTIADFEAVERFGVKAEGNAAAGNTEVLGELAGLIADGELEIPVAEVVPLDDVQRAYRTLEHRHTRGKIVLQP